VQASKQGRDRPRAIEDVNDGPLSKRNQIVIAVAVEIRRDGR
jgi:hypothetical protein